MTRRRTTAVLVAALASGLLAVGCNSEDNGGVIAGDPNTPVTSPPGSDDTSPPAGGGARLVEATPGLDGVAVTAIDSVVVIDDTTLEIRFYNGVEPCYGVDHVTVDETPTAVTVEVGVGSNPDAGGVACIEIAELQGVRVSLTAPLGDRAVIDASTGAPAPLS